MTKSFFIAATAVLTFVACTNKKNADLQNSTSIPTVNQDSIEAAHGHSHTPSRTQAKEVSLDSTDKAHGHQH